MPRRRPTFWIATASVAALALGGGVAAANVGAPTRSTPLPRDAASTVSTTPDTDDTATTTTTVASTVPTTPPQAPPVTEGGPGHPWVEDHGVDDPATHDVGDDHGVDEHGADDPATHDVGDDHSGPDRGPGSGDTTDDSGHGGSGHDGSGHD